MPATTSAPTPPAPPRCLTGATVCLSAEARNNRIGVNGPDANASEEGNVISGNMYQGVGIDGTSSGANTTGNIVAGNYIGTNATGTAALPNTDAGVYVYGGAQDNRIGVNGPDTNASAERNVISGNAYEGVVLSDPRDELQHRRRQLYRHQRRRHRAAVQRQRRHRHDQRRREQPHRHQRQRRGRRRRGERHLGQYRSRRGNSRHFFRRQHDEQCGGRQLHRHQCRGSDQPGQRRRAAS